MMFLQRTIVNFYHNHALSMRKLCSIIHTERNKLNKQKSYEFLKYTVYCEVSDTLFLTLSHADFADVNTVSATQTMLPKAFFKVRMSVNQIKPFHGIISFFP